VHTNVANILNLIEAADAAQEFEHALKIRS